MTRAYSNDLRQRVVDAVLGGATCSAAAERFGVSHSSAIKWARRYRQRGNVFPDKMGGHRPYVLEPHRDFILQRVKQTPHMTLARLQDLLAGRGVHVSHDTVWRFLRREGLSFKKKPVRP